MLTDVNIDKGHIITEVMLSHITSSNLSILDHKEVCGITLWSEIVSIVLRAIIADTDTERQLSKMKADSLKVSLQDDRGKQLGNRCNLSSQKGTGWHKIGYNLFETEQVTGIDHWNKVVTVKAVKGGRENTL
jgi:hypothetical protein